MLKYKGLVLFLAVALLTGCALTDRILSIKGSGNVVTQEMDITGFDKVDINHAFDVEITHESSENFKGALGRIIRLGITHRESTQRFYQDGVSVP